MGVKEGVREPTGLLTGLNDEVLLGLLEIGVGLGNLLDDRLDGALVLSDAVIEVEERIKVSEPEIPLIDLQSFPIGITTTHYARNPTPGVRLLACLDREEIIGHPTVIFPFKDICFYRIVEK